jgi:hypothetical protein
MAFAQSVILLHMIFKCLEADKIWKGLGMENVIQSVTGRSSSEVLATLLNLNRIDVVGFD